MKTSFIHPPTHPEEEMQISGISKQSEAKSEFTEKFFTIISNT